MTPWFVWFSAVMGTAAALILWFRDVHRIMCQRQSTLQCAASQLAVCRRNAFKALADSDARAVAERSEKIYSQAVDLYNQTLRKPWYCLPALLMGFRFVDLKDIIAQG